VSLTLTYRDLRNPDFMKAIRKVVECTEIKSVPTLLRIVKVYKTIADADAACTDVQKKLLRQHGILKQDGTYDLPNRAAFDDAFDELLKTEFQIEGDPIKYNELLLAKLNAADIVALGVLITV